ncbi:sodium-dependent transporter [Corynebacterium sp. P7003]|uniref:Transporter n=1 Tax=Corynebacterium pygosceleis TaxID=2800406 RepID=A0ABT3WQG5_9CORY|nr:sodium-dependent transporter [Corynebacterium pygosceleis]MCX7444431.1 sodium-dependent transporter [Corynebacterium pygosceleis]
MAADTSQGREVFSTRIAFLLAAIGSAVGLGNIWRFPYVAYENGGGAFLIPYMVALITAGIPLLFLDYAMGHRFRGSAPLAYRRLRTWAEPVGWVQVGVCFIITIYYAAIIGWAALYTLKSFNTAWGSDPNTYFFEDFLKFDSSQMMSMDIVPQIALALAFVWILAIIVLAMGVDEGIGRISKVFMPILTVLFILVVGYSVTLEGAAEGLNAFFTPNWAALSDPGVWVAAYGQIFFSLSICFGIMLTYSSYLKPRTNLTGTGLVTAFANSSFEVLAGIGVFSALGYMAVQQNVAVDEVATSGIGLAFIAFPTIINQMPLGPIFGVMFFGCLTVAGFTSLFSLLEVVVSAVKDKLNLPRKATALSVGVVMTLISLTLFATTSGLATLDIMDKFVNNIGIVGIALVAIIILDWILRRADEMALHLNAVSSFRVGNLWRVCVVNITTIVLGYTLLQELISLVEENYGGYTDLQINVWGWGVVGLILAAAVVMSLVPWRGNIALVGPPGSDFGVDPDLQLEITTPQKYDPERPRHAGFAVEQLGARK